MRAQRSEGWPGLDGLRALAAFAVVDYHLGLVPGVHIDARGGYLAVDVFFVLSGFLITGLCLREWDTRGTIGLGRFYLRRLVRLYPALLAVVAFAVLLVGVVPTMTPLAKVTYRGVAGSLLYYGNIQVARDVSLPGDIGHLWSIATEEQFYILWAPVLLLLLRLRIRRAYLAYGLLALAASETVGRTLVVAAHAPSAEWYFRIYFAPDLHSDGLLLGCAIALLVSVTPQHGRHPGRWAVLTAVSFGSLLVAVIEVGASESTLRWAPGLASLMAVPCILSCVRYPSGAFAQMLALPPLRWVGRRSYGVYLWHFPLLELVARSRALHDHGEWVSAGGLLSATLVASALSWTYVESPALRLRDRLLPATNRGVVGEVLDAPLPAGDAVADGQPLVTAHAGTSAAPTLTRPVAVRSVVMRPVPVGAPAGAPAGAPVGAPAGAPSPSVAGSSSVWDGLLDRAVDHPLWSWPVKSTTEGGVAPPPVVRVRRVRSVSQRRPVPQAPPTDT